MTSGNTKEKYANEKQYIQHIFEVVYDSNIHEQ